MSAAGGRAARPLGRRGTAQRGAALVIAAIVIAVVVAFAVTVAGGFTRSEVRDTYHYVDSVEAMMLAETGLEVALWQFGLGVACGSLAGSPYNTAQEVLVGSSKTYQITNGATTQFDGSTALSATQCRVQSTGTIGATGVSQKVQAILDMNLLGGLGNGTFNSPTTAGATPTNWTGTTASTRDDTGGLDCSRALYARRTGGVTTNATATNSTINYSLTRSATTTTTVKVTYDIRVNANAGGATVKVTLNPSGFNTTSGTHTATVSPFRTVPSTGTYSPCSTGYGTRGTFNINVTGTGALSVTGATINLNVDATGTDQEAWLDNVELVDISTITASGALAPTAVGAWRVVTWHDCRTESCP